MVKLVSTETSHGNLRDELAARDEIETDGEDRSMQLCPQGDHPISPINSVK